MRSRTPPRLNLVGAMEKRTRVSFIAEACAHLLVLSTREHGASKAQQMTITFLYRHRSVSTDWQLNLYARGSSPACPRQYPGSSVYSVLHFRFFPT